MQTIREYAEKSGNFALLNLLRRFEGFQANRPVPVGRRPARTVQPVLSDQERDYASIMAVLDRLHAPAGRRRLWEVPEALARLPATGCGVGAQEPA